MVAEDRGARFNLKAVVRQTGVKPDTLRAWERRYGLPSPDRSAGRHRLYSQRDIEIIRWLAARQEEGLSISRAVELWRENEARGRDALAERGRPRPSAVPSGEPGPAGDTLARMRERWLGACLSFDEQAAEQIVTQAFALYPPETVCLELLQRGVAAIGDGWYRGETTVQQEHFTSALAIRRLEAMIMAAPPPSRPGRILAAAPPGEQHVFGLLLLSYLLRRRGWEVVYLGADVPVEQMEVTVEVARPRLVVLAAQRLPTAATLLEVAQALRPARVPLAYGGMIFNWIPALRARFPGHFLGEEIEGARDVVETLMATLQPAPEVIVPPAAYALARAHYGDARTAIEAQVLQSLQALGMAPRRLAHANQELGHNIDAALALGDMAFLGADIEWLEGMLRNRELPREVLPRYLEAYRQAAGDNLDERGQPVMEWLSKVTGMVDLGPDGRTEREVR